MFAVQVLPITKNSALGELSYFSAEDIAPGTIVLIPVRKKRTPALVLETAPAVTNKTEIKKRSFPLRKISSVSHAQPFSEMFLNTARDLATYYGTTSGAALRSLVPISLLSSLPSAAPRRETVKRETKPLVSAYEASFSDRIEQYRLMIRSSFAGGQSVYVISPTYEESAQLFEKLSKGIEHRAHLLTSTLQKRELVAVWQTLVGTVEPVLVVLTPSFIALPRNDLGLVILERESARSYEFPIRPYLHVRDVALFYSQNHGATLLLADSILSVTTRGVVQSRNLEPIEELKNRIKEGGEVTIIDVRRKNDLPKKKFVAIEDALRRAILDTHTRGGHSFICATRKGYASAVVCNDCGERVSCNQCGAPIALETRGRVRLFTCRRCNARRNAHERCALCSSWNLQELGIGSERVAEEMTELLGSRAVFYMDAKTADNYEKSRSLRDRWRSTPGAVLIGTERTLPYIRTGVELSGIASLDSLLAIPEWQAHERAFSLIAYLREISKTVMVQSRRPSEPVLHHAASGDIRSFVDMELALRKEYAYPPYATIIRISLSGSKKRVELEHATLLKLFEQWSPVWTEKILKGEKYEGVLSIRLRGEPALIHALPDNMRLRIRTLPAYMTVRVHAYTA